MPPLFIGEVTLGLGLVALATTRGARPRGALWTMLGVVIAWAAIRVGLGLGTWELDAARDGMLVFYALFAIVAAGLVLDRPERLRTLISRFGVVVWGLVLVGAPVHFVNRLTDAIPEWPWAEVEMLQTKSGDLLVLLAAAVVYLAARFKKPRPALLVGMIAATLGLMVTSRGGMLGFVLGLGLAWAWRPASVRFGRFAYVTAAVLLVGAAVGSTGVSVYGDSRDLSVGQLVENVLSLGGQSQNSALEGTAEWRLEWWGDIVGYTFGGEHFAAGKGFGVNLASDDGYQVTEDESLRSPHNSHLTVLARGGVPMFLVWLAIQAAWFVAVARSVRAAKRDGLDAWAAFYAVCGAIWLGGHVNASFDVYLEGPMGAVWFWTAFGLALAGTQLQRTHPQLLDGLIPDRSASVAPRAWAWTPDTPPEPAPLAPPRPAAPALPTWDPLPAA